MEINSEGIFQKAVAWLFGLFTAALISAGAAVIKVWRHEERIRTLERQHSEKIEMLGALAEKIDANHNTLTDRLTSGIEDIRADLRIITQRCLVVTRSTEKG